MENFQSVYILLDHIKIDHKSSKRDREQCDYSMKYSDNIKHSIIIIIGHINNQS